MNYKGLVLDYKTNAKHPKPKPPVTFMMWRVMWQFSQILQAPHIT
jgi:hypothetical protein